jgi:glutathione synthase/RimK-type ligase-like ATP-grasp enzyme
MKRCAFLTTDDLTGFVTDDDLAVPALQERGWQVDHVPWRADAAWDDYDVVIIRSTWDYQDHPAAFDNALARIDASAALLCNPLPLMRWNMRKTYLRELARRGVALPPTSWGRAPSVAELRALFEELQTDELVIKPVVGANADHAWRLHCTANDALLTAVSHDYVERDYLAQPFLPEVLREGEWSLIYFAGELSHTILKTPKPGDFRVQEEHGGIITAVEPEPALQACGEAALTALDIVPLYARADFVRADGGFVMMELELIEPALYFRMADDSPARFAAAVERTVAR